MIILSALISCKKLHVIIQTSWCWLFNQSFTSRKVCIVHGKIRGKKLWNETATNARIFRDVVYTFLHRVYNTTAFSGLCARRCQGLTSSVLRLLQFIIKNISKHSSLLPYCIIVMPFSREKFNVSLWHNFRKIIFLEHLFQLFLKPFHSQDLISNSPNCLPNNSHISWEILVLDWVVIP